MGNITVNVEDGNNINLQVTPTPRQTIQINRGVQGASGNNDIGGFPVSVTAPQNYDALMFLSNEWTNIPQTELSDGGNF
jgi:hypothetical protein